jgi:hypothetical protein
LELGADGGVELTGLVATVGGGVLLAGVLAGELTDATDVGGTGVGSGSLKFPLTELELPIATGSGCTKGSGVTKSGIGKGISGATVADAVVSALARRL